MPKTFSQSHLVLARPPEESSLVQLLGESDSPAQFKTLDVDGVLRIEPRRIPLKFAAVVVVLFAVTITALAVYARDWGLNFEGPLASAMVAMTWLAIAPGVLAILWTIDRRFAKLGAYFRLDRAAKTIWIRDSDATVDLADVVELVELERWHRLSLGPWDRTRQWTIVVRSAAERYEVHPVLREGAQFLMGNPLGKLLTDALGVRRRRIRLTLAASKALDDC